MKIYDMTYCLKTCCHIFLRCYAYIYVRILDILDILDILIQKLMNLLMTFFSHRSLARLVDYRKDIWISVNLRSTTDEMFSASMAFYHKS